jgi:hypothetical protein
MYTTHQNMQGIQRRHEVHIGSTRHYQAAPPCCLSKPSKSLCPSSIGHLRAPSSRENHALQHGLQHLITQHLAPSPAARHNNLKHTCSDGCGVGYRPHSLAVPASQPAQLMCLISVGPRRPRAPPIATPALKEGRPPLSHKFDSTASP